MQELTNRETRKISGGMDGVPYHYKSQRIILPPWPNESNEPIESLGPLPNPPQPRGLPQFGG